MVHWQRFFAASAATCSATNLYVTSYAGTVTTLSLSEAADGSFNLTSTYTDRNCGSSPSWLTLDSERGILYCLDEGLDTVNGSVNSYLVGEDGQLFPVSHLDSITGPVSSVLYGSGYARRLAAAHYTGGAITTWDAPANGSLARLENVTFSLDQPGPDADRQDAPHEHQAILDPSGQYLLVPDLGADLVRVFGFDNKTGALVAKDPLAVVPGSGPRHATFWSPSSLGYNHTLYLFVVTELGNTVTSYAVSYPPAGGLKFKEVYTTNTFGGGNIPDGAAAAEIAVSPDQRFLLISNRNDTSFTIPNYDPTNSTAELSDSLATFALNANGTLSFAQLSPAGGSFPRDFSINTEGDLVAVTLQESSRVVIIERDIQTGLLGDSVANFAIDGELTSVVWDEGC